MTKLAVAHAPVQACAHDYVDEDERDFARQLSDFVVGQATRLNQLASEASEIRSEFL